MEEAKEQTETEDLKGQDQDQENPGQETQDAQDTQKQDSDAPKEGEETDAEEPKKAEEAPAEPDWKDRYARAMADFDNFRKRTARDREDLVKFAASDVMKDILPTVDNLARALDEAKDRSDDPFVEGVRLVYDGLLKARRRSTPSASRSTRTSTRHSRSCPRKKWRKAT